MRIFMQSVSALLLVTSCALSVAFSSAIAQRRPVYPFQGGMAVEKFRMVVRFPEPWLGEPWPSSDTTTFYAWRVSVTDGAGAFSVVLRPKGAKQMKNLDQLLDESKVYLCPSHKTPVMECTKTILAYARRANKSVELDIRDAGLISRTRKNRPFKMLRQSYEPGGRFHVDDIAIIYK